MVAYYVEIGVRRSSCSDDDVGFRPANLDGFVVAHERAYHSRQSDRELAQSSTSC
jgi:hypothetical protein